MSVVSRKVATRSANKASSGPRATKDAHVSELGRKLTEPPNAQHRESEFDRSRSERPLIKASRSVATEAAGREEQGRPYELERVRANESGDQCPATGLFSDTRQGDHDLPA